LGATVAVAISLGTLLERYKHKKKQQEKESLSPQAPPSTRCVRMDRNAQADSDIQTEGEQHDAAVAAKSFDPSRQQPKHLVVMVHGLHGSCGDFTYMSEQLQAKFGGDVLPHAASCNSGFLLTHEGIDVGGRRLAEEVEEITEEYPSLEKISILGHSLGGLYSRYCVGVLFKHGVFDRLKPVNFITLASPHVGSRRSSRGWINPIISTFTRTVLSATGRQLMLEDGVDGGSDPLLVEMSKPESEFYQALTKFERRVLYANVLNDLQVPYPTSAIVHRNPYTGTKPKCLAEYPHIVADQQHAAVLDETWIGNDSNNNKNGGSSSSSSNQPPVLQGGEPTQDQQQQTLLFSKDDKGTPLRTILQNLQTLNWERVDVFFAGLFAHEKVVVKRGWMPDGGADIVSHMIDNLKC
jgi:hypothetical protein